MRRPIRILPALMALALASPALAQGQPAKPASAPPVTVMTLKRGAIVETVLVTGTLLPREEILVGPEIEGLRIAAILVDEGDHVAKGQVLVRLVRDGLDAQLAQMDAMLAMADSSIEQAKSQISQAEASISASQPALQRARDLLKSGAGTQAVLEQRESDQRANAARLTAAREGLTLAQADRAQKDAQRRELLVRIARTEIKAPEEGIISRRTARLGAIASSVNDALFRIIAKGQIELEAEVPETRLGKLKEGQPAQVFAGGEDAIAGTVRLVSPEVDRATRLGRVRVALPSDARIRIGAFARASIEVMRKAGIAVPASAVFYDGGEPIVQVVTDGRVHATKVTLGLVAQGSAEITQGLKEGDTVIARAGAFLRDGDGVTPVESKAEVTQ